MPVVLQEGEVAAGGWSCSKRPGLSWASSCLLQAALLQACQEPKGNCAAELLLVPPLHKGSIPSSVGRGRARGPSQPDLQGALGWVTATPQAGWDLQGRAHTVWQGRALPLVGHQHSATRRKPRRKCSGTLVLTSWLSSTLGGAFKFHLFREGVTSDLGCRAGSTSRNGSGWCKPCPCPSLPDYLFPQRYQANSKAFKLEGGLKQHATIIESCRQK